MQYSGLSMHPCLFCRFLFSQPVFFRGYSRKGPHSSYCQGNMREAHHIRCAGNTCHHGPSWPVVLFLYYWFEQRGLLEGLLSFEVLLGSLPMLGMVEALNDTLVFSRGCSLNILQLFSLPPFSLSCNVAHQVNRIV